MKNVEDGNCICCDRDRPRIKGHLRHIKRKFLPIFFFFLKQRETADTTMGLLAIQIFPVI